MLQNKQMTLLLHLCVCIMLLISSTQSNQYPPIVTPNYKANRGCPKGLISRSFCPEVNCHRLYNPYPFDKCLICRTCPHLEKQPCGGPYYVHGVCDPDFICLTASLGEIPLAEVMSGVNVTGRCRPLSCRKDCSIRKKNWVCGTDGVWRYNKCFLRQAKCYLEIGQTDQIRIAKNTIICGPMPTAVTPTSVSNSIRAEELSSSSKVTVEPTSVSSASVVKSGNSEQTRTSKQSSPSNQPVNNRPVSLH